MVSNFQYLTTCIAFSKGKPFRKAFYTNLLYTISVGVLVVLNWLIILVNWNPDGFLYWSFFNMLYCPAWYRWQYVATGVILNTILTFSIEYFIMATFVVQAADRRKARQKQNAIDSEIAEAASFNEQKEDHFANF
jgi:cation-transporting ATPase 13A3/4/5